MADPSSGHRAQSPAGTARDASQHLTCPVGAPVKGTDIRSIRSSKHCLASTACGPRSGDQWDQDEKPSPLHAEWAHGHPDQDAPRWLVSGVVSSLLLCEAAETRMVCDSEWPAVEARTPGAACVPRTMSRSQQLLPTQGILVPATAWSRISSKIQKGLGGKSEILFKSSFPKAANLSQVSA